MTGARRTSQLKELLRGPATSFLLEAHSALSARIAEEAGFAGIWASGLGISAQAGVRDHNELSWTQVLDVVELMADATAIPILLDGDTGYGDFNNMRRLVCKLEQRGGAGVCIEDKCFPKTNSFIQGESQELADVGEFCGKIKAGKDSQSDPDFCIVARVEALIAGRGMEEALRRAEAYHAAGADAILIHSKHPSPQEVLTFAEEWGDRGPLVIVPTTYGSTPPEVFRAAGIRVVVWANALLRGSVAAMQAVASALHSSQRLVEVEGEIAPLQEIFRLQGAEELLAAERRYAPAGPGRSRVIILAATRGAGLEAVTAGRPKAMLPVGGRPLLRHVVDTFKSEGVHDLHVVLGYRPEAVDPSGLEVVVNPDHERSGELRSLACALDRIVDDTIVVYGDVLFRGYILRDLLHAEDEITVVVDSAPFSEGNANDLAYCSARDDRGLYQRDVTLHRVSRQWSWNGREPDGRWIGMVRFRERGARACREILRRMSEGPDFDSLGLPDLLDELVRAGLRVSVQFIHGHWLDVNDLADLERANAFAQGIRSTGGAP